MRNAGIPGQRHRPPADGALDPGPATQELQVALAHGHIRKQARRRAVRASWISHGKDLRRGCLAGVEILFLRAILQQPLQFVHEFLYVLEIQINRRKPNVGDLVQLLQMAHQQAADFRRGALAIRSLAYECLGLIHDGLELANGHGPLFARFQQSLQNLLALKFFAAPVLLDDHVRNFVNAFVGGEPALAFYPFAAPPDQVAGAPFARVYYLVIQMRAEGTLHCSLSLGPTPRSPPRSASASNTASSACASARAMRPSSPIDHPSRNSSGTPARQHPANVISQSTIAVIAAGSFSTPKISVSTRKVANCEPPPMPGSCAAEPTNVNASTRLAPARLIPASSPPKACATQKYTNATSNQCSAV